METVLIVAGGVLLLILALVWAAGGARRAARRLVGASSERACPMTIRGSDPRRWLVGVRVTGREEDAIHSALSGFALSGDMLGQLIERRLSAIARDLPRDAPGLSEALGPALKQALLSDGFDVEDVKLLGSVSLADAAVQQLGRYVATEAYHRDRSAQQRCSVLDFYMDGVCARGDWTVDCAPKAGGITRRLSAIELLSHRDFILEVAKDGKSIVMNRSLKQMLAGK